LPKVKKARLITNKVGFFDFLNSKSQFLFLLVTLFIILKFVKSTRPFSFQHFNFSISGSNLPFVKLNKSDNIFTLSVNNIILGFRKYYHFVE
jgi:hypothetical protein